MPIYTFQKNQPDSALHYLNIIQKYNGNYAIAVNNATARAYMQKNDTALAAQYLTKASTFFEPGFIQTKKIHIMQLPVNTLAI